MSFVASCAPHPLVPSSEDGDPSSDKHWLNTHHLWVGARARTRWVASEGAVWDKAHSARRQLCPRVSGPLGPPPPTLPGSRSLSHSTSAYDPSSA